jgi:hypothetical protein
MHTDDLLQLAIDHADTNLGLDQEAPEQTEHDHRDVQEAPEQVEQTVDKVDIYVQVNIMS